MAAARPGLGSLNFGLLAALIIVAAIPVVGLVLLIQWFYQAFDPLNTVPLHQSAVVRQADSEITPRIDKDAAALTRGAPWLTFSGRHVTDTCALSNQNSGAAPSFLERDNEQWQCTRQVAEVLSFTGSIQARHRALVADLQGDGWKTYPLQSLALAHGTYEQATSPGPGQTRRENPPGFSSEPVGSFSLEIYWMRDLPSAAGLSGLPAPVSSPRPVESLIRRGYARHQRAVLFVYTDIYAAGTGPDPARATTPPPSRRATFTCKDDMVRC